MRILIIVFLLLGSFSHAQFFESNSEESIESQSVFDNNPVGDPDQGLDEAGNPTFGVPINQWISILVIISLILGSYLERERKLNK